MSNPWDQLLINVLTLQEANQKAVWAYLRANQPCTLASVVEGLPSVEDLSVGAIVGNGVRNKRITFELRKVPGARRKVKFYSEVK
jgi:hypothetical protein